MDFDKLFGDSNPSVEPSALARQVATNMFDIYKAFIDAGFPADVAAKMIQGILAEFIRGAIKDQ